MHLETDTEHYVKGPPILFSEFEAALSELKMERQKSEKGQPPPHIPPPSAPLAPRSFLDPLVQL